MSTKVAEISTERMSLLADMARRYSMEPAKFAATLRATVVPKNASNEEFAAFLMVASTYNLNPITKEIYAFPKQGGGIQPIVSVDGWANLINSHPQCDGIEFDDHLNDKNELTAITCRIYRKDRSRPTTATEYMAECSRPTSTWKQWPRRMLRHKALIQAARYAFGFAGIVDPDEAERFTNARDVTPKAAAPLPPKPPVTMAPKQKTETPHDPETGEVVDATMPPEPDQDPEGFRDWVENTLAAVSEAEVLEQVWNDMIAPFESKIFPPDFEDILGIYRKHEQRLNHD